VKDTDKKNPFANCKPRSQWKKPKISGRVRGRLLHEAQVGEKDGEPLYKLFVFELTTGGLSVRPRRGRRANAVVWSLDLLANSKASGQLVMII
jgi:hypothetical protein